MVDYGYDVVDFCDIDLFFGGMLVFEWLVVVVYWQGIKVIMDVVFNYISLVYLWFQVVLVDFLGSLVWDCYFFCDGWGFDGLLLLNNWELVFGGLVWI